MNATPTTDWYKHRGGKMDQRARAIKPSVGEELRCLRRTLGVSPEALADRTGLAVRHIERIETGELQPRPVVLAAFALALGTTHAGRRQWLAADTCFARLLKAGPPRSEQPLEADTLPQRPDRLRLRAIEPCLACGRSLDRDLAWEAGGYDDFPLLAPLCGRRGCPPSRVRADLFRGIYGDADYAGPDGILTAAIWLAVTQAQQARGASDPDQVARAEEAIVRAEREVGRWTAERMDRVFRLDE